MKVDNDQLSINHTVFEFPLDWKALKKCFGEHSEIKSNGIYWKHIGISMHPHGEMVVMPFICNC
ncbi:DUF7738 domain-containing protein [Formosa undariae]|uniref:DUF7738 domain-containing protein n=1 Tax=Formosa undariae TaxID=1325436 RepID=UPI00406BC89E